MDIVLPACILPNVTFLILFVNFRLVTFNILLFNRRRMYLYMCFVNVFVNVCVNVHVCERVNKYNF